MNKVDRAKILIKRLEEIYPETPIPLDHQNNFTLLVAVVLSAQSTDKKVNELTPDLFAIAPTPERMYQLGEQKVFDYIKQFGLAKTKAKISIIYQKFFLKNIIM